MLKQQGVLGYATGAGINTVPVNTRPASISSGTASTSLKKLPPQTVWHKLSKHPRVMPYIRWFALTIVMNIALFVYGLGEAGWWANAQAAVQPLSYLVLGNFTVAILIRQHHVINGLFWLATRIPVTWPLSIRWAAGKVYHFGGLHSSCATMGTLWFGVYLDVLIVSGSQGMALSESTVWVTEALLVFLIWLVCMALPQVRSRYHNSFELMHRLGGWTVLVLFWAQTLLLIRDLNPDEPLMATLMSSPAVWALCLITGSIVLPWLNLRRVKVDISRPSSHVAVAKFNYGVKPFAGSSTALSRSPLKEWHSFANIPSPHEDGFRLTISRAGDWTGEFIDDKPSHVWVKAIPTAGVGNVDQLFKRVLWVATGSGIGPCLPHLLAKTAPGNLVWSTRTPTETYGQDLVNEILAAQPDAMIWDTNEKGKPNMLDLVREAYERFQPEAVICISNKKLTYQVVYDMESRGIPAFGAIWDS